VFFGLDCDLLKVEPKIGETRRLRQVRMLIEQRVGDFQDGCSSRIDLSKGHFFAIRRNALFKNRFIICAYVTITFREPKSR
jgi:hypothetical protein